MRWKIKVKGLLSVIKVHRDGTNNLLIEQSFNSETVSIRTANNELIITFCNIRQHITFQYLVTLLFSFVTDMFSLKLIFLREALKI